jgi:hypothetical protein
VSEILVVPPQLLETAPVYTSKASAVTTFGSEVDSATRSLVSTLEGSGLPLGGFLEATTTLIDKAQISFDCAEKNLESMANGLVTSAHEFSSTDTQLAALFSALDAVIPEFAGYEPAPMAVPGQTLPAELRPHLPPKPQHHSWWSWLGSVGSFIGHHWQYVAAGAVVVGSVGLDIISGGTATVLTPEEAALTGGLVGAEATADVAGAAASDAAVSSSSATLGGMTITGADMAEYEAEIEAEMEQMGRMPGVASRL